MSRVPFSEPGGWVWPDTKNRYRWDTVEPELTETENPVVATLLGPDGKPLRQMTERRTVPFGYQSTKDRHDKALHYAAEQAKARGEIGPPPRRGTIRDEDA